MDQGHDVQHGSARATRLVALAAAALVAASCATVAPSNNPSPAGTLTPSQAAPSTPTPVPSVAPAPTANPQPTPEPTPQVLPAGDATLAAVYAALRPENLRSAAGPRVFARGDVIPVLFEIVNRSTGPVVVPLTAASDRPASWYGVIQTWIEPRGKQGKLDACLPTAERKGGWSATGGMPMALGGAITPLQPDEATTQWFGLSSFQTACLPAGRYRYHLE